MGHCQYRFIDPQNNSAHCLSPNPCTGCNAIKQPIYGPNGERYGNQILKLIPEYIYNADMMHDQAIVMLGNKEQELKERAKFLNHREETLNKIRAKPSSYDMNFKDDSRAYLIIYYDIQQPVSIPIEGIRGKPTISQIIFEDEIGVKSRYFLIEFPKSKLYIQGTVMKCEQNDYLFKCFERAGVSFDESISRTQIQKALFSYFIEKIHNTDSLITISNLNGWDLKAGKYLMAADRYNHLRYIYENAKVKEPSKRFIDGSVTVEDIRNVDEYYGGFRNKSLACICFVIPYVALIRSLFKVIGINNIRPLVIVCDSVYRNIVQQSLMTFDVDGLDSGTISMNEKRRDIVGFLADCKDELVIANSVYEVTSGSSYRRSKLDEQIHEMLCIANGVERLPSPYKRDFMGYLVILSDYVVDTNNAYVLEWNEKFCSKSPPRDAVSKCWSGFVRWIENHWQNSLSIIKNTHLSEYTVFSVTWSLLKCFYNDLGFQVNIFEEEPAWNEIFRNDIARAELLDIFRDSVIRHMSDKYLINLITYKDYYGFESEGFGDFLARIGLAPYKAKIIKKLKDEKQILCEDSDGNTYRLKNDKGHRNEYYLILKRFFDVPGEASLADIIRR